MRHGFTFASEARAIKLLGRIVYVILCRAKLAQLNPRGRHSMVMLFAERNNVVLLSRIERDDIWLYLRERSSRINAVRRTLRDNAVASEARAFKPQRRMRHCFTFASEARPIKLRTRIVYVILWRAKLTQLNSRERHSMVMLLADRNNVVLLSRTNFSY